VNVKDLLERRRLQNAKPEACKNTLGFVFVVVIIRLFHFALRFYGLLTCPAAI
jgi:hypothetical protein